MAAKTTHPMRDRTPEFPRRSSDGFINVRGTRLDRERLLARDPRFDRASAVVLPAPAVLVVVDVNFDPRHLIRDMRHRFLDDPPNVFAECFAALKIRIVDLYVHHSLLLEFERHLRYAAWCA